MLQINSKSILQMQIEFIYKKNIDEIVIITGPYKDFGLKNVLYINDKDYHNHDVLGSLMATKEIFNGKLITSYSDIIFEEKILEQILNFQGDIGIPIDLDWEKYVGIDERFYRDEELQHLKGDCNKAKKILNWKHSCTFESMLDEMIEYWIN